jgi:transposase-like protein
LPDVIRDHEIAMVRERYADFGPTFAAEKLAERHDLKVSRETLRSWMRQAGSGHPALSASASSNLGIAASILVSWSRSTAQSIAGSRIEQLPARYWCSSTMRQAA